LFLATTADQRFWKKDEKILFLGEWCKLFNQKPIWSQLEHEVLPYHWQSREKYFQDNIYLSQLYESWLPIVAENLNTVHNENHSCQYWRTVIGVWLYYFIQIFYERYLSIRHAADNQQANLTWVPHLRTTDFTPKDFHTFCTWQNQDDYNLFLYSWLIKKINTIPVEVKDGLLQIEQNSSTFNGSNDLHLTNTGLKRKIKRKIKYLLEVYSKLLPKSYQDIVLVSLYARKQDLIKLQLALGQFPDLHAPHVKISEVDVSLDLRSKLNFPKGNNEFTSLLSQLIPSQIPKSYLENYQELNKKSKKSFPKNPKVIVAANAHYANEGFKVWCAYHMEKGTQLIGMPHGSNYGTVLWNSNETHEQKVADYYLSWGWEDEKSSHVIPFPSVQLAGTQKQIHSDPEGGILWVGMSRPRYSCWYISAPRGCEMLEYIDDQKVFLGALDLKVKKILKIRSFHTDYGWNIKERLIDAIPGLHFSDKKKTLNQELCKSRLCVSTYNSSPMLETLSANFPTIAFWNFNHLELRDAAIPYFEDLVRVGIVHKNPASAASKVNEIYQDPMLWWLSPEIQEAKNRFCHQFARTSSTWVSDWKKELFRIAKK
jgi:putative transferase (TIGR04331 family)